MASYFILGFPLAIFAVCRVSMPNVKFEFDFDVTHGTWFLIHDRYAKIGWMIFGFGVVGAFAYQRFIGGGNPPVTLLAAAIYALLFNAWMIVCYENYLGSRYPKSGAVGISSYTVTKYSVTYALGVSAIVLFVCGLAMAMLSMRA